MAIEPLILEAETDVEFKCPVCAGADEVELFFESDDGREQSIFACLTCGWME